MRVCFHFQIVKVFIFRKKFEFYIFSLNHYVPFLKILTVFEQIFVLYNVS